MLSIPEKIIFALAALATLIAVFYAVRRLVRIIAGGHGKPDWRLAWKRLFNVLGRMVTFQPVFRFRFWPSFFHALVGWGFGYYILVNLVEVIRAYLPGFEIPGLVGDVYRFLADILTVALLLSMAFFVVRRFVFRPANLSTRQSTLLSSKARFGIKRDSAIVAAFIILHVGAHFVGESLAIARAGKVDISQPFASALATLWVGTNPQVLVTCQHIAFWLAIGLIMAFLPYFAYSKHVHLFFAPLNYLLKPERRSIGELSYINLDDSSIEQFGAAKLADLGWEQVMDAYACIMCFRCQEVCPAYSTGKILSPAALEINKRYFLNSVNTINESSILTDFAIPAEAVWACTSCGACLDICPVKNEPMRDILDIRRDLVMMENSYPKQLESAFRGMERTVNPWGIAPSERMKWAQGLDVPTIEQNPQPELLWWVGCAPATDERAQKSARAFAKILNTARVNFAVLGQNEQCTGDSARRAGREDIFFALATANVEILNEIKPKRIVTTCPHCLHTLKNEYPSFGGNFEVIHHTQLIKDLIECGILQLESKKLENDRQPSITYHDPCYLGRHNGIYAEPREILKNAPNNLVEMPRHADKSFCCGAGGAQMWKEEEKGSSRVNSVRIAEAEATGVGTLATACPFCMIMLTDAARSDGNSIDIKDVAEIIAERIRG
jgi:Fe-S oxidoreductase